MLKNFLRRNLLSCAAIGLTLVAVARPLDTKAADPVAVVSFSTLDELLGDVEYLFQVAGVGPMAQMVLPSARNYAQGLDSTKPFGLAVIFDGSDIRPLGFVAVNSLQTFLNQIRDHVGEPTDLGDGVLQIQGPQTVFIKEVNGWAFLGNSAESLQDLPENPASLLDGLNQSYDVAVRAYVQRIPEPFRQMAIGGLQAGFRQGLAQNSAGSNNSARRQLADYQIQQLEKGLRELDRIELGLKVDHSQGLAELAFTVAAMPNSELAQELAASSQATTRFAGFLPEGAALRANIATVLPAEQIDATVKALDAATESIVQEIDKDQDVQDAATRDAAKRIVNQCMDIVRETAKTGRFESAFSLVLEPKSMTLLSASHVADGKKVDALLKDLIQLARQQSEVPLSAVQLNTEEHAGVRLHRLAIPIPDDEYVRQILGEQLEIYVGTSDQSAYLSVGTDSLNQLKKAIDASPTQGNMPVAPFQAIVSMSPIMKFASSIEENLIVNALSDTFEQSGGKDHVRVEMVPVENGITYRMQLEEGVLKGIGQAVQLKAASGF